MTVQSLLLGIAAGIVSAIVFASATTGPALPRVFLFLLTPFPLYLAGLGLGVVPAAAGAATAALAILSVSSPVTASIFAANAALPALVLTHLSRLSRTEDGTEYWYPTGRVVAIAAVLAASTTAALLIISGADEAALVEKLKPVIVDFLKTQMPSGPDGPALSDIQIEAIATGTVPLLPGFISILLMMMSLLSLWLAGRTTLASGRLRRPWPLLAEMELPPGSALALLASTLLARLGGKLGPLAGCFAGTFQFAFALQGLAVAHYVTLGSPWRNFLLSALYAALIILTPYVIGLLALAGLAETIFRYRWAKPRSPPPGAP